MRLTGSGTYSRAPAPRMPPGLVELMEGLTKDVLRNNPTNIYEFCANHMEKLIEIRDGPSRKKSLTLEKKIAIAQKKVRQKAKERQQRYDAEILSAATAQPEKQEFDQEAPNSSQQELLPHLRLPVHHEQDLTLTSEMEISLEPSTENSLTLKDSVIEDDEIPISKSSTVSSISKSTVIDLLNNDQELANKEYKDDDEPNVSNESDVRNANPDETSVSDNKSHTSDAIDQNVLIETPTIIPDLEKSATDLDEALEKEKLIGSKNNTLVKSKSASLDSENLIVDSGTVDDIMDTSIEVSKSSPQPTEPELEHTTVITDSFSSDSTKSQMEDSKNMDNANGVVSIKSSSNMKNEQPANKNMDDTNAGVPIESSSNMNNEQPASVNMDNTNGGVSIESSSEMKNEQPANINMDDTNAGVSIEFSPNMNNEQPSSVNMDNTNGGVSIESSSEMNNEQLANINMDDTNAGASIESSSNMNNEQPANIQITEGNINMYHTNAGVSTQSSSNMNNEQPANINRDDTNAEVSIESSSNMNNELPANIQITEDNINMDDTNARVPIESSSNMNNEKPANILITEDNINMDNTNAGVSIVSSSNMNNEQPANIQITEDNINMDDTNAGVPIESSSNMNNEQPANNQITGDEKPSPAVQSSNSESDLNLITHIPSPSDLRTDNSGTNKNSTATVKEPHDEHTAKFGCEEFDPIENAEIHHNIEKETDDKDQLFARSNSTHEILSNDKVELDENYSTSKENKNEVDINEIKNKENMNKEDAANENNRLNKYRRESSGDDNMNKNQEVLHEDTEKEKKDSETKDAIERTTHILKSDSENDVRNSIVTDELKDKEDDSKNDNENLQNNMDLETAAVTIQKVFRSFLFKSRNSTFEDITNDEAISMDEDNDKKEEYYAAAANLTQDRRPLGLTRMDSVLQTVNEEKSLSLSTDDSSTLSSAATTIQAHVRGFLVRNKLNSYKTVSTNSLVNSNEMLDTDSDQKSKTVLNIHIVPEQANYLSRDESLLTSMDLSLDGSPPSSVNLHPLSYDLVSERRKLLKREDAIQSISPPSNNSGKLSEDSVKEVLVNENNATNTDGNSNEKEDQPNVDDNSGGILTAVADVTVDDASNEPVDVEIIVEKRNSPVSPDESDVVTPFASPHNVGDFENTSRLLHSGEFHDVLLPTKVSRSDTTVVREFKNVLAYILLWNAS